MSCVCKGLITPSLRYTPRQNYNNANDTLIDRSFLLLKSFSSSRVVIYYYCAKCIILFTSQSLFSLSCYDHYLAHRYKVDCSFLFFLTVVAKSTVRNSNWFFKAAHFPPNIMEKQACLERMHVFFDFNLFKL